YELIAQRERDPRRAEILRRMAAAESGHRARIERRLEELGVPPPDPTTVKLPLWTRLQARLAPVDRLLAAREAAEDSEVDDLYKRPTGDETTDLLLRGIRKEQRPQAIAVQNLRAPAPAPEPSAVAVPGAQERLDRILHREKWHET